MIRFVCFLRCLCTVARCQSWWLLLAVFFFSVTKPKSQQSRKGQKAKNRSQEAREAAEAKSQEAKETRKVPKKERKETHKKTPFF